MHPRKLARRKLAWRRFAPHKFARTEKTAAPAAGRRKACKKKATVFSAQKPPATQTPPPVFLIHTTTSLRVLQVFSPEKAEGADTASTENKPGGGKLRRLVFFGENFMGWTGGLCAGRARRNHRTLGAGCSFSLKMNTGAALGRLSDDGLASGGRVREANS